MAASFVAAVILTAAGQPFPGLLLLAFAAPTAWRYVRRELALGALLAEAYRTERQLRRIPLEDLRTIQV